LPAGAKCLVVSVECEGLPATTAELRITPNKPDSPLQGVVLLGGGGAGRAFFADTIPRAGQPALTTVRELASSGYVVVERRWQVGWFGPGSEGLGVAEPSCRHAALLQWIKQSDFFGGALCAFGNSGGASEIAYGLTRWNTEELLDAAFFGGGPPMSRVDIGCLGEQADANWSQTCSELWQEVQPQCGQATLVCSLLDREGATGRGGIDTALQQPGRVAACSNNDGSLGDLLLEDSVLYPAADLDYPNTHLHFIFGRKDCTEAVPLGLLYVDAVKSATSVEFGDGVEHTVFHSQAGNALIVDAIKQYCVVTP
jgi:hypothetical protein